MERFRYVIYDIKIHTRCPNKFWTYLAQIIKSHEIEMFSGSFFTFLLSSAMQISFQFDDFLTKNKRFKKLLTFARCACSSIFHRILHPDSGFLQDPINQCAQLDQDGKPSPRKIWITKRECIKFESTWLTS